MNDALFQVGAVALIGGFAGLVNYAQRFTGDNAPPWKWQVAAIKVGTGAFVGLLTLWALEETIRKSNYVYLAVAITGYGGPLTLDFGLELGKSVAQAWAGRVLGSAQKDKDDAPKN